jgi:class 3 adenylate cyclase
MQPCSQCGEENTDRARFCQACGTPLESKPPLGEARKIVTVIFCDVADSTALGEKLDPESIRKAMSSYFEQIRTVLERHGGTVEKFIGDAVMAVFGVPTQHEDDALRAARAAVQMRDALRDLNKTLDRDLGVTITCRIGVNTGEVVAGDASAGQAIVTGDAVNVAARLEQAAPPGEILIGKDMYRLVRQAVAAEAAASLELKGKSRRISAYRLISVAGPVAVTSRFDAPMVGRHDEFRTLDQALRRAARNRACVLATVLGPAGIGKSRLIHEFLERQPAEVTVARGRCLPYGEGITYWPVVEILTGAAGIDERDRPEHVRTKIAMLLHDAPQAELIAERLAQFLGVSGATAAPEETHWAVRKLLEAMASRRPLIAVFDDLQWAEPALLDLLEHVADWSRDASILLLCLARPELLDARPAWGGGKLNATSFLLEPLTEAESEELISNLLDRTELPAKIGGSLIESAEGNPLFVEQLVGMMIDDGLLRREADQWVVAGDLADLSVPASVMALLDARLDRLSSEERAAIERASVEGKVFHRGSVLALSPEPERARMSERLMSLVRRDLIRPDRELFVGEDAFRFRHMLIRDAAYRRIPKERKADLHEQHADWLERVAGERVAEYEEVVGYHLERAYLLRTELGPPGDRVRALAERAGVPC